MLGTANLHLFHKLLRVTLHIWGTVKGHAVLIHIVLAPVYAPGSTQVAYNQVIQLMPKLRCRLFNYKYLFHQARLHPFHDAGKDLLPVHFIEIFVVVIGINDLVYHSGIYPFQQFQGGS